MISCECNNVFESLKKNSCSLRLQTYILALNNKTFSIRSKIFNTNFFERSSELMHKRMNKQTDKGQSIVPNSKVQNNNSNTGPELAKKTRSISLLCNDFIACSR